MVVGVLSDWIAGGSWGYAAGLADGRGSSFDDVIFDVMRCFDLGWRGIMLCLVFIMDDG